MELLFPNISINHADNHVDEAVYLCLHAAICPEILEIIVKNRRSWPDPLLPLIKILVPHQAPTWRKWKKKVKKRAFGLLHVADLLISLCFACCDYFVQFADDVYNPTDEPHGTIEATLTRTLSRI